jgi:hypothetical protein
VNTVVVYLISTIGLPGLAPISPAMYLFIFAYGLVTCLLVNDLVKVPLAKDLNIAL